MKIFLETMLEFTLTAVFVSLISIPLIYICYLLDILYGASIFFFIITALSLLAGLSWMWDCKGKQGCFSGVIFILPILVLPVALALLLADYFIN